MTLNGFYKGAGGDISWNGHRGGEERDFAVDSGSQGAILLMGRVTYEMMTQWWPTPAAIAADPEMAATMNDAEKIVFSRSLRKADWAKLVKEDAVDYVRKLKQTPGPSLCVLGSGTLITQLAKAALVDEFQFMINPVTIETGASILPLPMQLDLVSARPFSTGSVLLTYKPAAI